MKQIFIYFLGIFTPFAAIVIIGITGLFDVSATVRPSKLEQEIAHFVINRSVSVRAPKKTAPKPTPQVIKDGIKHYRASCVVCHGAPGVEPNELAQGLNPKALQLDLDFTQQKSDGMLYQILSHGIRMTGMPAFSKTHKERELWNIVAFLRHLPSINEEERKFLKSAKEKNHHH